MPIGDTLVAILQSLQDPRLLRMRAGMGRAAGPLARLARSGLVRTGRARLALGRRRTLRPGRG
ncbi:hypothetical protein ACFOON_15530 [Novosphingobium piscinae]|uniref:Uncharacterized protein n=1 Tax=Novosphingobium piscinae TaxID=1507448 RepID=A0A7X1FXA0_9SPHN|nr:hypothetical protein [Novosphingobium piscinae]MBC2668689.1 hypothetical protein [Novosphingobium piscinae]